MTLGQKAYQWFILDGYLWDWLTAAALIIINHVVSCTVKLLSLHAYSMHAAGARTGAWKVLAWCLGHCQTH